ncbi:MAG: lysophospholipid acyltransferase family protein [Smithellaceae bacterium]|jgi:1-acyl-sn-glycerol-3-phosphate acyltransferase
MDRKSELFLQLQYHIGRITVFFIAPLYFFIARLLFYRVHNLKEIRRQCAGELSRHKGPWIICANHLTMIDSFLLTYAIFSFGAYLKDYKKIPWNLPERSNFQKNIVLAVLCYLSKCIPVDRGGPREKTKQMLEKCMYLMRSGQNIMIFPEGGRSRTGRVDKEGFSYGVGRFIQDVENCKIMCVYMRGDRQATYGFIPAWGEKFHAQVEVFSPVRATAGGLRAQREYAAQIIDKLVQMEEKYFVLHRQRCRGLEASDKLEQKQGFPVSEENPHQC